MVNMHILHLTVSKHLNVLSVVYITVFKVSTCDDEYIIMQLDIKSFTATVR